VWLCGASLEAERERIETLKQQVIAEQARTLGTPLSQAPGIQVEPAGPAIEVGGLTSTILADELGHIKQSLHVVGVCPECGHRTYATFSSLVELGAVLSNPPRCAACRNAATSDAQ
jgi:hypothetical protein